MLWRYLSVIAAFALAACIQAILTALNISGAFSPMFYVGSGLVFALWILLRLCLGQTRSQAFWMCVLLGGSAGGLTGFAVALYACRDEVHVGHDVLGLLQDDWFVFLAKAFTLEFAVFGLLLSTGHWLLDRILHRPSQSAH